MFRGNYFVLFWIYHSLLNMLYVCVCMRVHKCIYVCRYMYICV